MGRAVLRSSGGGVVCLVFDRGAEEMTKQEFWDKVGYAFEIYDIPCKKCPAYNTAECDKSCGYALKAMYERLERDSDGKNND